MLVFCVVLGHSGGEYQSSRGGVWVYAGPDHSQHDTLHSTFYFKDIVIQ